MSTATAPARQGIYTYRSIPFGANRFPSHARHYRFGTQKWQILDYLMRGSRLNAVDAMSWFGCARLASRVDELRADGWPILSNEVRVGKRRFASYRLRPEWIEANREAGRL